METTKYKQNKKIYKKKTWIKKRTIINQQNRLF